MNFKKNFIGLLSLLIILTLLVATACESSDKNSTSTTAKTDLDVPNESYSSPIIAVKPPFPNVDVPFISQEVQVNKGMTFETETGTSIEIPANAFVDKDGKPVKGVVEVKFREFHDAADIIVSGIPMHNPGTGAFMETGGMFELQGNQNGKEIFIDAQKDITVNLASFNEGDDFNYFALNKDDLHWEDKGAASAEMPNTNKAKQLALLDKQKPKKPLRPLKQSLVDGSKLFDLDIDYSKFPTLEAFSGVIWKYSGQGVNIEKEKWVFQSDWDRIEIKESKTGFYELNLSNKDKSVTTYIQPVLQDEDYEKALAIFNKKTKKKYDEIVAFQKARRERFQAQANMYRSFSVNGFGIRNCDIWSRVPNVMCRANFDFDKESGFDEGMAKETSLYLILKDRKAVIPYRYSTNKAYNFNCPKDANGILVAVMPKGKVAMFKASDFAKLDMQEVERTNRVTLAMETSPIVVGSNEDLSLVLDYAMAN